MLVAKGWAANPAPEVGKRHGVHKKAASLLVRLDTQRGDVLRFATDFRASWDDNQAERDVRIVKLQPKISGSWRTLAGARAYCAIRATSPPSASTMSTSSTDYARCSRGTLGCQRGPEHLLGRW